MNCEDYDPANWWKTNESEEKPEEIAVLTETQKKIAHYEKRARYHWKWWKESGDKGCLYHYKQTNIKIRKLKMTGQELPK